VLTNGASCCLVACGRFRAPSLAARPFLNSEREKLPDRRPDARDIALRHWRGHYGMVECVDLAAKPAGAERAIRRAAVYRAAIVVPGAVEDIHGSGGATTPEGPR
jgi:hypothetical protein